MGMYEQSYIPIFLSQGDDKLANKQYKGITFEFNGNATKLSAALSGVNKDIRTSQGNLRELNKCLKLDPGNNTLLKQRFSELKSEIDSTKTKLNTLKTAQKEVEQQFADGKIDTATYQAFQRELGETEAKLKSLKETAKSTGSAMAVHFKDAGEKISATGDKISGVGEKLLPVSTGIAAAGGAAIKFSSDFEESGNKVSTIADTTQTSMSTLEQGVMDLSNKTGESASDLNDALYQTISAGVQTKDAVSVLGTAVETAKGGFTDTTTAVDTLTTVMNSYQMKASEAKHVSDLLIQTQNLGKTTVGELGQSLGNVIPTASAAGVSFKDLMGSIAELTKQGLPTSEAITGMKAALSNVIKPSADAAKEAEKLGINFNQAHLKSVGWAKFLDEIKQKTGGNVTTMGQLFGSVEALNSVTVLAGKGSSDFSKILSQMGKSAGTTDAAFNKAEKGTGASFTKAINSMKNALIKFGDTMAPIVQKVAGFIQQIGQKLQQLSPQQKKQIVQIAAIVAAAAPLLIMIGKLVTGIGGITVAIGAIIANPIPAIILGIIAGITALIAGLKHLYDTNAGFRNAVITIWNGIKIFFGTLGTFFKTIFSGIITAVKSVVTFFQTLPQFFTGLWTTITTALQNFWNNVVSFFTQGIPNLMNNIKNWFMKLPENIGYALGFAIGKLIKFGADAIAWAAQAIPQLINNIGTFFSQLPGKIWNFLVQAIQRIKTWGSNCISYVASNFPRFVATVIRFFQQLPGKIWNELVKVVTNIGKWIGNMNSFVASHFPGLVSKIVGFFKSIPGKMLSIGGNIVRGIWNGISGAAGWLWDKITGFAKGIVDGIKGALGIHSPSKVMADEVGQWMAKGIGQGFVQNMDSVSKQMQAAIPTDFDINMRTSINSLNGLKSSLSNSMMSNSQNGTSDITPVSFQITQGNIIVQGNADNKAISQIKQMLVQSQNNVVRQVFDQMQTLNINSGYVPIT
jgi:TP901 family phage tail tape measure protein